MALLLAVPLLLEIAREIQAHGYYATMIRPNTYEGTTPLKRYLVRGPLAGASDEGPWSIRQASYLGSVVLLLAVLGLLRGIRSAAVWFWAASPCVMWSRAFGTPGGDEHHAPGGSTRGLAIP